MAGEVRVGNYDGVRGYIRERRVIATRVNEKVYLWTGETLNNLDLMGATNDAEPILVVTEDDVEGNTAYAIPLRDEDVPLEGLLRQIEIDIVEEPHSLTQDEMDRIEALEKGGH